jgi:fumarate reductase flavoprotein subunit
MGDGIRMAWEAGAGKGHMEMERILGSEIPGLGDFSCTSAFRQARVLVVSPFGERIMNEDILQNGAVAANVVMRQKGRCMYSIIDSNIVKYMRRHGADFPNMVFHDNPVEGFDEQIVRAQEVYPETVFIADSIEELAEKIGADPDTLVETVERYNEQCDQNFDDDYCKKRKYLTELKGKRYYALKFRPSAYGSLGGIKISSKYEVITDDWDIIKGFYGAGSDVCDIYAGTYLYYLAGNTMGFAVNSGRIAGTNAANYILNL